MDIVLSTYAAYSKNEETRRSSSSGGIFSLLAKKILEREGVVYGVTMSQDCKYAEFVRVNNPKDIAKIQGSKYLQAKMGKTYQYVKADLESGLSVLFSGTGCQINGLKGYLGKEYENLYCVDVICHGVPSPKLWKQYVQYVETKTNAKILQVNFRCKDRGWSDCGIKRIDSNHIAKYVSKDKDPYMLMFLRDYCLRPSCYECVAKKHKFSDLTIADFWGIDNVLPEMNDKKGVSLVIIRSEKGQKLFKAVSEHTVFKEVSYNDGVSWNPAEYKSATRPGERTYFFKDMSMMAFEELEKKYAIPTPISLKQNIKKTLFFLKSIFSK